MQRWIPVAALAVALGAVIGGVTKLKSECQISFPVNYQSIPPTTERSGKRIYLYPGLDANVSVWSSGPLQDLVHAFSKTGHHVVLLQIPKPAACFFDRDDGAKYSMQFLAALGDAVAQLESAHGPARLSIVGGVSFGGLHALQAATSGKFQAWFAHVPVVRIDALIEFPNVSDVKKFNPQFSARTIVGSGLITWGTEDMRVNWRLTKELAGTLAGNIQAIEYPGQSHSTTPRNVEDIAKWVNELR